jgi:hypothetical protein
VIAIAAAISLGAAGQRTFPHGTCDREGKRLLGQKPVRRDGSGRVPPTLRQVQPKYPEVPPGTSVSGIWMAEALIDSSGKVTEVWPLRELRFTPPFPAFNMAITEAIRQWKFEQLFIDGKPVPLCTVVTVHINWQ